ncbi:DUF2017 domain-containing protein [Luteococcus sanguinis]|uniref:DUF2017 domain-containing protein n=1 Tax=Luteococcus sanguinis TaxID=174038 RepID=A0ABW1WXT4_9ACTN
MKGFKRDKDQDVLVAHFDNEEAAMLAGLVDQLAELLTEHDLLGRHSAEAAAGDPFALWEREFSEEPSVDDLEQLVDEVDPVVRRLFPDAYPDDPAASWEFRRFTQSRARTEKVADAETVMADLQLTDRKGRCRVPDEHQTAWLKTLANVRLALAVRLDITDEISADEVAQRPDSDPRAFLNEVYQWLGYVQESLLEAMGSTPPSPSHDWQG